MIIQTIIVGLAAAALSLPAWACSPPPMYDYSGFQRHAVGHLPKNARGVIFQFPSGTPQPADFGVESSEDKRRLAVRVHAFTEQGRFRLELVGGFRPGARYRFRYLPAHGKFWRYPDNMHVAIDDAIASTGGSYAVAMAPQPMHRMVTVMTSSGSCVEPAPAVVQEFTYAVPPALAPYRDVLQYDATMSVSKPGMTGGPEELLDAWKNGPSLYDNGEVSLGGGYDDTYNAHNNAIVAPCGERWPRVRLGAAVRFPEVDELVHRTREVDVDLNRNIEGQCGRVETLLQTVGRKAPEPILRRLCRAYLAGGGRKPLRAVELEEWVFELEFFSNSISPTCNLVSLAYLWHAEPARPQVLDRLGLALHKGLAGAGPADRDEALHALAYLVDQLPPASRPAAARRLLGPSQPLLLEALADPHAVRPEELARLIGASRNLPAAQRQKLRKTAEGASPGAAQARAILSSQSG